MSSAGSSRVSAFTPAGTITRGTTASHRLRRVDSFLGYAFGSHLRAAADPLVVDLGFGASPVTTVELADRLGAVAPAVRVVGLDIDAARVAAAAPAARPPRLEFRHGGFELAGLAPVLVRALNVLRQYDESDVDAAWRAMAARLRPGGVLIEGTCDEAGRLGCWLTIDDTGAPVALTLAAKLSTLDHPGAFAARLPKALIHHNVPGQPVHELLAELDHAWAAAAGYAPFGPRQRFARAVAAVAGGPDIDADRPDRAGRTDSTDPTDRAGRRSVGADRFGAGTGWPIRAEPRRWRRGELTVAWSAVAPR